MRAAVSLRRLLMLLLAVSLPALAGAVGQYAYRVSFVNKAGTADLAAPLSFLSQRAIDRKAAQGIPVDSADLPVSPAYIAGVVSSTGGVLHCTSRWFNQVVILVENTADIAPASALPYVSAVTLVGYFPAGLHNRPAQPAVAAKPAGDPAYYGAAWAQTSLVHGDALHDAGYRGQGKLIAMLDVGYLNLSTNVLFETLRNSGRILDRWNFVTATSNVEQASQHGTSGLSTMAADNPNAFVGSAPMASYALYITEELSSESLLEYDMLIAGAERADSLGADVINCSLGYVDINNPTLANYVHEDFDGHTTLAAQGVNMAVKKGIFWTNSAGNEGGNAWNFILTPADADSSFTVGGVTSAGNVWSTSSPGVVSGGRVKPEVCLQGEGVATASGDYYSTASGTSFAAPQMAGYAACMLGALPGARPYEIRNRVLPTASIYTTPTPQLGYGIPNFIAVTQQLDTHTATLPEGKAQVFPVPFDEVLYIRFGALSAAETVEVRLVSSIGTLVYQTTENAAPLLTLNMPVNIPAGVYVVSIRRQNGQETRQTIVRRGR